MGELFWARGAEHRDRGTPAAIIKYGCAWCSEECAERAGDYDTDEGQLFGGPYTEHGDLLPDLSGDGRGMVMVLDALTHRGLCPTLLFDDDGRWALSFVSMTSPVGVAVPMDDDEDDVFALVWDESMTMAVALAADRYLSD